MAACDLKVELDSDCEIVSDGSAVRGTVVVRCHKDMNCKGLRVSSNWTTHGRGNVDRAEIAADTIFEGEWLAGQEYRYPFELPVADWPPTYYGTFMNVSHSINARAKIAWAIDPKASAEFVLVPTHAAHGKEASRGRSRNAGLVGWVIFVFLVVFLTIFAVFLLPVLFVVALVVWLFNSYLPKSITGNVECELETLQYRPGETIRGIATFMPRRSSQINGVSCTLRCEEVCVSGSGSNRRTHRHTLVEEVDILMPAGRLPRGKQIRHELKMQLPKHAAPSIDLSDNDVRWQLEWRVDVPWWPDFVKRFDLVVAPVLVEAKEGMQPLSGHQLIKDNPQAKVAVGAEWAKEVLAQLNACAASPEKLEQVLEAIESHRFDVSVSVGPTTSRPAEASHVAGGVWHLGYLTDHDLECVLHWSKEHDVPEVDEDHVLNLAFIAFDPDHPSVIARVHCDG